MKVVLAVAVVNWLAFAWLSVAVGGTAFFGEATAGGGFTVSRGFYHEGPPVSEGHWLASLAYGSLTVALTPLAVAFAMSRLSDTLRRHAALRRALLGGALAWLGWAGLWTAQRLAGYLAAAPP